MKAPAWPIAAELAEVTQWDNTPPPRLEEQELGILAFELWKHPNCPETVADECWLGEEGALRCHASCL